MNNGAIGQIPLNSNGTPKHNCYNTDAIWGGFWNLTQLWALAYPDYYADWVQGQLLVYKDAGWLGDGLANSKYCLLYTSPSPRDGLLSRMPSSA